jgi:EAL domain-containing protein (putative c-di-GMP-specific phosphodiesterase class I)
LRDLGCDELQGYHFSKPLPADEIEVLIRGSAVTR